MWAAGPLPPPHRASKQRAFATRLYWPTLRLGTMRAARAAHSLHLRDAAVCAGRGDPPMAKCLHKLHHGQASSVRGRGGAKAGGKRTCLRTPVCRKSMPATSASTPSTCKMGNSGQQTVASWLILAPQAAAGCAWPNKISSMAATSPHISPFFSMRTCPLNSSSSTPLRWLRMKSSPPRIATSRAPSRPANAAAAAAWATAASTLPPLAEARSWLPRCRQARLPRGAGASALRTLATGHLEQAPAPHIAGASAKASASPCSSDSAASELKSIA